MTTNAFRRIMGKAPSIDDRLDQLSRLNPHDREAICTLSAEIRQIVEGIAIPGDLAAAITRALARFGEQARYAVRSSATAEDLPTRASRRLARCEQVGGGRGELERMVDRERS